MGRTNPSRVSSLNANGTAYGYAVPGVEFTYLKIADIRTFSVSENGAEHVEVLYGIKPTENTNAFLSAIGLSTDDRYAPADMQEDGQTVYYYQSDKLITGLHDALSANSTVVKNKLEKVISFLDCACFENSITEILSSLNATAAILLNASPQAAEIRLP